VEEMVSEFEARRDYMVARLKEMPGLRTPEPEGAFYVFPSLDGLTGREVAGKKVEDGGDLAMVLLEEAGVAVVPGAAFGKADAVRLSYAASMDLMKKALDRMEKVLRSAL
jgi:aspartate/methionine/tyrosine aminotransferase